MDELSIAVGEAIEIGEVEQFTRVVLDEPAIRSQIVAQEEDPFAQVFRNCPPIILNSPNKETYASLLASGWTAQRVSDYAQEKCGENISRATFGRLKDVIRTVGTVHDGVGKKLWAGVEFDATVDAFQEMMSVAMIQKGVLLDTLAYKDAMTQASGNGQSMMPALMKQVSEQAKAFFDMMQEILRWQEKFGIVLKPQNGGKPKASLRQSLDELSADEKKDFYKYLSTMRENILSRRSHRLPQAD